MAAYKTLNINEMVFIQLNVNSIRSQAKKHQLEQFIRKHKPHIMFCSETNLNGNSKINFNRPPTSTGHQQVYRPPTSKIKSSDLISLLKIERNANYIIAGDYNAHNQLWNSNRRCINGEEIENWYEKYKTTFKMQLYHTKEPTCFRGNEPSKIDFAFLSDDIEVTNCAEPFIVPTINSFSDHKAIMYSIRANNVIEKRISVIRSSQWKFI